MTESLNAFTGTSLEFARSGLVSIGSYGLLAMVSALMIAAMYRMRHERPLPEGAGILIGSTPVSVYLTGKWLQSTPFVSDVAMLPDGVSAYLLGSLCVAGTGAVIGSRLGEQLAIEMGRTTSLSVRGEAELTDRSGEPMVEVVTPDRIGDAAGYRAVDDRIKDALAGRRIQFPAGLTIEELESRLVTRIEQDFDVDYVDVDFDSGIDSVSGSAVDAESTSDSTVDIGVDSPQDCTIDRVDLGCNDTRLGPTLPPKTVAVAIRVDPTPACGPGDMVEVWATRGECQLISTGVVHATVGSRVTIIVESSGVHAFDTDETYRLVTRRATRSSAHEFRSLVDDIEETVASVTVDAGGPLDGEFVGWLPVPVLVLSRSGSIQPFPNDSEPLESGDELWVLASQDSLEQLAEYESRAVKSIDSVG